MNRSPNNTKRGNRQKECLCDKYQSHSWKNRSRSTHSLCYFISFVVLIFGLLLLLFCLQKRKFIASFLFWYTSFATKQIGLMVLKIPAKGTLKTVFWTQMTKHCDALFLYYLMITNLPFFTFFPTTSKIAENLKDKYQNSWAAEAKPGRDWSSRVPWAKTMGVHALRDWLKENWGIWFKEKQLLNNMFNVQNCSKCHNHSYYGCHHPCSRFQALDDTSHFLFYLSSSPLPSSSLGQSRPTAGKA